MMDKTSDPEINPNQSWLAPLLLGGLGVFGLYSLLKKKLAEDRTYDGMLGDERLQPYIDAVLDTTRTVDHLIKALDVEANALMLERRRGDDLERIHAAGHRHTAALRELKKPFVTMIEAHEAFWREMDALIADELRERAKRAEAEQARNELLENSESVGVSLREQAQRARDSLTDREREVLDTHFSDAPKTNHSLDDVAREIDDAEPPKHVYTTTAEQREQQQWVPLNPPISTLPTPYNLFPVGTLIKIGPRIHTYTRKYNAAIELVEGAEGIVVAPPIAPGGSWPDDAVQVKMYEPGGQGMLDVALLVRR